MPTCPVCAQENPAIARFCLACGAALSDEPRREERKVVTVLFADLVGFTSRAERLDPEDVRAVLAPYWERLRGELERFGGTVEKFIGDAVMALFGAPVAHEDDPERAVRAALAIRDWVRESAEDLQVRIAVNTGEALVLLGARPAEGEGMAAGDVVNTAARLQASAPVNGILVGEATYRATRDAVEYTRHEPVVAKGKSEPIAVWEAVQARSRVGVDVEERAATPLVGRTRELETVVAAFERARREREPQLVTLVGVPGIGKSRLVAELFARLDASPDLVWWRQGRTLPYGEGVSFWALGEMVKAQAGINENDAAADVEAKLRETVESSVDADDRAWVVQHLLPLVGVEPLRDVGDRRDERFTAWRRYLEGLAEQRPLVLVFEDLHWADDGLLDFVDHLAEWASGVPLLVLGTARPELLDRRSGWGGGKLNATTLALTALSDDEAALLLHGVLRQAALPAETQRALLDRAGGNPLYAEQFARLYLERGSAEDLPLPETVQGIIAARLDGLEPGEKQLLQDAAVVGKVFWAGAAAALSQRDTAGAAAALHALERKGLVRRERRSAVVGEEEYAFRHVLVRDVAYGQIPRAARGEKHAQVAAWIEGLGRADDHAELVAHHYAAALELRRAAGEPDASLVTAARVALRRAGERALRLNAFVAAERLFAQALESWPDDEERPYVVLGHARARFYAQGAAGDELDGAAAALEAVGDLEAAAEAAVLAAHGAWRGGRGAEAEERIDRARRLLEGRAESAALVAVLAEQGRIDVFADRSDAGLAACRRGLELAERLGLDRLRASVLNTLGVARMFAGDLDGAAAHLEQAAEIESPEAAPEVARALVNLCVIASVAGEFDAVEPRYRRAHDFATRVGDRTQLLWLEGEPVYHGYHAGRWDEVLARAAAFLETVEEVGGHYLENGVRIARAQILAHRDEVAGARRDLEHALALLDEHGDAQTVMPTLVGGATVLWLLGEPGRAGELLDAAARRRRTATLRAPGVGGEALATIIRLGRAEDWRESLATAADTRRVRAARALLAGNVVEAADEFLHVGGPLDEAAVRLFAAEQLAAEGRLVESAGQLERALAFYRAVGAHCDVRHAQALLAQPA